MVPDGQVRQKPDTTEVSQKHQDMFTQISNRQRPRRSPAGLATSLALHLAACGAVLYLVQVSPSALPKPIAQALTFVSVRPIAIPSVPAATPVAPPPAPRPRIVEAPPPPLPAERVETHPRPRVENVRAEVPLPASAPPPMLRERPTRPEPVKPALPQPTVGAFPSNATQTRTQPQQSQQMQVTGFDAPAARSPELKLGNAAVGGFDRAAAVDPKPGSDRPAGGVIADAGFGATGTASAQARSSGARTIGESGFNTTNSDARSRPAQVPVAQVQQTGFSDVRPSSPSPRPAPRPDPVSVPVEVIYKPAPAYTDEARSLKLEGDVLLEVQFRASGQVRVVRLVRGLGHGLDEAAMRAAEHIQFKPARSASGPVDFQTIVHITFRLT